MNGGRLVKERLTKFLLQTCKKQGLSLRSLSINAGLSAGTVHSIINREYEPTLFSLNQLADYLKVKRQYLWYLAGLLEDMDYDAETKFGDPRLRFHFAQIDKLPTVARMLIISLIEVVMTYLDSGGQVLEQGQTLSLSGDNKGLMCPFRLIICDEGYYEQCPKYQSWRLTTTE